jgi:hypothetical protein
MSTLLLGLGVAKLTCNVSDLRAYIRRALHDEIKSWRLISVVSIKTFLFLGNIFLFYEYGARRWNWPLSLKLSWGIRLACLLLSFERLLRYPKEAHPKSMNVFIAIASIASEFCSLMAINWYGRLLLSDEQLGQMLRYKVLIKQEWVNKTQILNTYQLLTKTRASELCLGWIIGKICCDVSIINFNGLYWLIKRIRYRQIKN